LSEIPLDKILPNVYNSRAKYSAKSISKLARSMSQSGQLVAIKVRSSPKYRGMYELVYGHRRVQAAKDLGWDKIRAEISDINDEKMIEESLIENLERDNLSDYEKALIFERINHEFDKTYEQIGAMAGISKSHVCNYLSMLKLFDAETLSKSPDLAEALNCLTERHARILHNVKSLEERANLVKLVVKDELSVRELTNIVRRLRSWFQVPGIENEKDASSENDFAERDDKEMIRYLIMEEFKLARRGDFRKFESFHLFGEGFTMYDDFPPYERVEENQAWAKEQDWFYKIAPHLVCDPKDFRIDVLGHVAIATLSVDYVGTFARKPLSMRSRGTVVLIQKSGKWKIFHEHWSRLRDNSSKSLAKSQGT
jgi:ParB family transcriptional regulator, chromosome partitioning protein